MPGLGIKSPTPIIFKFHNSFLILLKNDGHFGPHGFMGRSSFSDNQQKGALRGFLGA